LDNLGYLFAVYSVIWIVLFVYVLFLLNNQKRLKREIDSLRKELEEKRTKG
jgi:CcmD family protein